MTTKKSSSKMKRAGARTLEKGLKVLEAVERAGRPVTIQEVAKVTGIQRLAVYRLLSTLQQLGYIHRSDDKRYKATSRRRRLIAGYVAPLTGTPFREDVARSISRAALQAGIEVLMLDNGEHDRSAALQNAGSLLERRVDVAILFQPVESLGHMMADRFFGSGMPFITVEYLIQGGVYFGANNYQAGKFAGVELAKFAREKWNGHFDFVVLLEGAPTSTNVQARLAGALVGIQEVVGQVPDSRVIHLMGNANREESREAMAALLRRLPRGTRLLVSGFNDPSSVGAVEAVRAADRRQDVAIVGQNATREGRAEIRKEDSSLIASVAYFPERYGDKLLQLASAIARGDPVPPAVYTEHMVLSRANVDRFYPEPDAETAEV